MRVLIIHNPTSGSAKQALINHVADLLRAHDADVELYATQCAGDATGFLQTYSGQLDIVVAAGGDGTLNEVVNGLRGRDNQSLRIAFLPTGTTNVMALELGIPRAAHAWVNMLLAGKEKAVYPGLCNGRRFLLMVGIGFDAWVVDNVDIALKKRIGKLAYVWSMIKQLPRYGKNRFSVTIDGVSYTVGSMIITNGRCYGGSYVLSRKADLSKPTTQVLLMTARSPWQLLLALLGLPLGLLERMPGIQSLAATCIEVQSYSSVGEVEPVQADGDTLTHLPLTVSMETVALRVIVP